MSIEYQRHPASFARRNTVRREEIRRDKATIKERVSLTLRFQIPLVGDADFRSETKGLPL